MSRLRHMCCKRPKVSWSLFLKLTVFLGCVGLWTIHDFIDVTRTGSTSRRTLMSMFENISYDTADTTAASDNLKWAPFEDVSPENAKLVILLSYQRCGSTLVGQLFNTNPSVFYQFEPLDSLYSSLYGTHYGWNVPTDITSHKNGSVRQLPDWEIKEVSTYLYNLMKCRFHRLPTETLHHTYQFMFSNQFQSTADYIKCMKPFNITRNTCSRDTIGSYCGGRFNQAPDQRMADCILLLRNSSDTTVNATRAVRIAFQNYRICQNALRRVSKSKCQQHLDGACYGKSIRAVKTVRATMDSVELLLQSSRNARVIHLIRDPRGVTRSRYVMNRSVVGIHGVGRKNVTNSSETVVLEARAYCQAVTNDVRKRIDLERRYPGRILTVIYDDLVTDLRRFIDNVYSFLDMPLLKGDAAFKALSEKATVGRVRKTKLTMSPAEIANQWQKNMSVALQNDIRDACREFFDVVKFNFKSYNNEHSQQRTSTTSE